MLLSIICLPLFGFTSGILFGRYLGKGVCIIATSTTLLCCISSIIQLVHSLHNSTITIVTVSPWVHGDLLKVDWSFCFDSLTSMMLVVVTFISTLVHLYSTEYMENDPHLPRFMSYLSLFTFFMIILVTGNNFLQMFVGWEGVGLSSYLLINFWFTRIQANKAAIKAMLVNRVGDFFILLSMFLIVLCAGTLDYSIVFNLSYDLSHITISFFNCTFFAIDLICLFLFLGAMGKSAQLGLHTWLPDAMEGPTPVSALIHAATMVTAGVFLLTRCSFLFENSPIALTLVIFIGSMTAIFAATTGLFQNDMKKVIAYSTCSQLGYMVFACGLSSYDVGMFHLSNHAFFKALLFLGAGSVIHAMGDEQDMRKMGGLNQLLPFSYASALIGSFALIGFPFLAGYYSKDIILEVAATTFTNIGQFAYWLGVGAAFCTAFYSTRLILLVYLVNTNANKAVIMHAHEPSWRMSLPLLLLSTLSLFVGYLSKDFFIGLGSDFWNGSIFIAYNNYKIVQSEFLSVGYKIIPFIITILGVSSAYYLYAFNITNYYIARTESSTISWVSFFAKKWYIDRVYNELISQSALSLGLSYFYKDIDRGLIERIGPLGIYDLTYSISDIVKCGNGKTILNLLKMLAFGVSFLLLLPVMIDLNLLFL